MKSLLDMLRASLNGDSHFLFPDLAVDTLQRGTWRSSAPVGDTALQSNLSADIGSTVLVSYLPAGLYRVHVWVALTQPASSSSQLPIVEIGFHAGVDQVLVLTATSFSNDRTAFGQGSAVIRADEKTPLTYSTFSYSSSGVTPMLFEFRMTVWAIF